jgi:DNA-binding NarL/FixJ family response regulator
MTIHRYPHRNSVLHDWQQGKSTGQIARRYNCPRSVVSNIIRTARANGDARAAGRRTLASRDGEIIEAWRKGETMTAIARRLGCSVAAIRYRLLRAGAR